MFEIQFVGLIKLNKILVVGETWVGLKTSQSVAVSCPEILTFLNFFVFTVRLCRVGSTQGPEKHKN